MTPLEMLRCAVIRAVPIAAMLTGGTASHAQTNDVTALYAELDSLFADESIPDLIALADSLLAIDSVKMNTLSVRMGYVSKVMSAGRTFGFNQFGIVPGISFYHHTGLTAGLAGYASSEFEPRYYMTDLSAGYLKTFGKHWLASATHSFFMYHDTLDSHYFNKSADVSAYYQSKTGDVGVEYAFLYGDERAHRLTANISGRVRWKSKGFVNAITLMPAASFQWGNASVYYLRQPRTAAAELYQIVKENGFPRLTIRQYVRLTYLLESNRVNAARLFLYSNEYSVRQGETLIDLYYDGQIRAEDVFGFMNYCFSLPVTFYHGNWSLTLNYSYNIPVALPGEEFDYDPDGYFSASLVYLIQWPKK